MRLLPITLLLFAFGLCYGRKITKCVVYQYAGADSSKKYVALQQTFNSSGEIIFEVDSGFKENAREVNAAGVGQYYYEDRLLVKKTFADFYKNDTLKKLYSYNSKRQLIKEEHFECTRNIRQEVNKNRDVIFEKDLDKNKTCKKTTEIIYTYDEKGRKIKRKENNSVETWKYDSLNRISQDCSYSGTNLDLLESYTYFRNGYSYSDVWYEDGEPRKPEYSENVFRPIFTHRFYLSDIGNVVKHEITTERNVKMGTEITTYDAKGHITRSTYLDGKGQPEITHIYRYY